jgi:hypothetical protein
VLHRILGKSCAGNLRGASSICKEQAMIDAALIALGLSFFALSIGYAIFCDRV